MLTVAVLIKVLVILVAAGVGAHLFNLFVPLADKWKKAIFLVGGLAIFLYILSIVHLLPS